MFSKKDLIKLIVPLIFEQLLAVSVGFVDTFMVSVAGEAAVSGVSLIDTISTLLIQILSALATGGAVVCSQYIGNHDSEMAKKSSGQLIFIMTSVSAFLMMIALLFNRGILHFVFGSIEQDVFRAASTYFYITALSYPFLGVYNAAAALFRSIGNSRISMTSSLIMNLVNIAGNSILIFVFHMGVAGVAISTLVSRIIACVIVMLLLFRSESVIRINSPRSLLPDREMTRKILSIGLPSGLENSMFQFGKILVSSLTASFGTAAIAANSVANNITGYANIPAATMCIAVITVIGQCIGAGKKDEAKYYCRKLLLISYIGIWITNGLIAIFVPTIVGWFRLSPEATQTAVVLLRSFSMVAVLLWPVSFTLPHALRAAGDAKYTMVVSISSMWLFRVGSSYLLGKVLGLGVLGVWLGMYVDWFFRSIAFVVRFRGGKWTEKRVI